MLDKDAIRELVSPQAITAAHHAVKNALSSAGVVALPSHFEPHDLERFLPARRRMRGSMETPALSDFAAYISSHSETGATVFVDGAQMAAHAVLNLGSPSAPGHADHLALYRPTKTAAYAAMCAIATGSAHTQQAVAEFFEDWLDASRMEFFSSTDAVTPGRAIAAVRNVTIDTARKVEARELQLGASRSSFESVTASSSDTLPTHVYFRCSPHVGMRDRLFVLRVGVVTAEKPKLTLRIVNAELHIEEMAAELSASVREAVSGAAVHIGTYSA